MEVEVRLQSDAVHAGTIYEARLVPPIISLSEGVASSVTQLLSLQTLLYHAYGAQSNAWKSFTTDRNDLIEAWRQVLPFLQGYLAYARNLTLLYNMYLDGKFSKMQGAIEHVAQQGADLLEETKQLVPRYRRSLKMVVWMMDKDSCERIFTEEDQQWMRSIPPRWGASYLLRSVESVLQSFIPPLITVSDALVCISLFWGARVSRDSAVITRFNLDTEELTAYIDQELVVWSEYETAISRASSIVGLAMDTLSVFQVIEPTHIRSLIPSFRSPLVAKALRPMEIPRNTSLEPIFLTTDFKVSAFIKSMSKLRSRTRPFVGKNSSMSTLDSTQQNLLTLQVKTYSESMAQVESIAKSAAVFHRDIRKLLLGNLDISSLNRMIDSAQDIRRDIEKLLEAYDQIHVKISEVAATQFKQIPPHYTFVKGRSERIRQMAEALTQMIQRLNELCDYWTKMIQRLDGLHHTLKDIQPARKQRMLGDLKKLEAKFGAYAKEAKWSGYALSSDDVVHRVLYHLRRPKSITLHRLRKLVQSSVPPERLTRSYTQ